MVGHQRKKRKCHSKLTNTRDKLIVCAYANVECHESNMQKRLEIILLCSSVLVLVKLCCMMESLNKISAIS